MKKSEMDSIKKEPSMKKIISFSVLSFALFCGAQLSALTARDCGLTPKDHERLATSDTGCVYVTPRVCEEITKTWRKYDRECPELSRVIKEVKDGNKVVPCRDMERALDRLCRCDQKNTVLRDYREYVMRGDADICYGPMPTKGRALANCQTFAVCPTMPPTCMNNPNQTVICNLGADCLQACNALIENLWVSGCIFFQDYGELAFTAAEFGLILDESCTGIILDPQAPPYRLAPAIHVFTSDLLYAGQNCPSQILVRRMPLVGTQAAADPNEPRPAVDFCMPADFDVNSPEAIEIDLCFFTRADLCCNEADVKFDACYEVRPNANPVIEDQEGFGATITAITGECTTSVESDVQAGYGGPLNHYLCTICIPDTSDFTPGAQVHLVIRRVDTGVFASGDFEGPAYLSSITFRYPRVVCPLPVNC